MRFLWWSRISTRGGIRARRIYMLLGFRGSTESATGFISSQSYRALLSKIGGMSHLVKDLFRPSPYVSRWFALGMRKGSHEWCTVFCTTRWLIGVDTRHIPCLSVLPVYWNIEIVEHAVWASHERLRHRPAIARCQTGWGSASESQ